LGLVPQHRLGVHLRIGLALQHAGCNDRRLLTRHAVGQLQRLWLAYWQRRDRCRRLLARDALRVRQRLELAYAHRRRRLARHPVGNADLLVQSMRFGQPRPLHAAPIA